MSKLVHISIISMAMALLLGAGGCASMTPGEMTWVQTQSNKPRAGNVYMLRGFIGIWSFGINNIGEQLNTAGVRTCVYQDDQWDSLATAIEEKYSNVTNNEPLILIGHSFGADDVVRIARQLETKNIKVDLLVTLDPVIPPTVPGNVRRCYNIYQSNGVWDNLPFFRGIPLKKGEKADAVELTNADVRVQRRDLLEPGTNHFNIEKKEKIHREIVKQVLGTCPPREEWVQNHARPNAIFNTNPIAASSRSRSAPVPVASQTTASGTTQPSISSEPFRTSNTD